MALTERQAEGLAALIALCVALSFYSVFARPYSFLRADTSNSKGGTGLAPIALAIDGREKGIFFIPERGTVADLLRASELNLPVLDTGIGTRILHAGEKVSIEGSRVAIGKMTPAQALALDLPVDINGLAYEDLILIPGIGEKTAARIVEFREKKGAFRRLDDLTEIEGIKEKRFANLRKYFFIENPRTD